MDTRFSTALRKHLDGDLKTAETLYRAILESSPDEAQTRHYLGFLLQQTDRLPEACAQLRAAIALDERHADWHFNLGIALARQELMDEASTAFSRAVELDPDRYFYWTNLGSALESRQDWDGAERCYRTAAALDPACPDAFYLLSALCLKLARFDEARHFNYRGIAVSPRGSHSRIVLGQALYELGRRDDAIALFEEWLREEPDSPVASHLLAAYRGQQPAEQCSAPYVERTFDEFADSFDNVLGRLQYCGPQLVRDRLAELDARPGSLDVLDLGCGTGLVGEVLKPCARTLTGVDLSAGMLNKARAKMLYSELRQSDLADFLGGTQKQYDLICCMDTFIYLGRLDSILSLIQQRLKAGGMLFFSTEKLIADSPENYRLNISGRYSHHPDYLTKLLSDSGFVVDLTRNIAIRTESGSPIEGQFICACRR